MTDVSEDSINHSGHQFGVNLSNSNNNEAQKNDSGQFAQPSSMDQILE